MPLFSRKSESGSTSPAAPKKSAARPRVRLRKEELAESNKMSSRERIAGWVFAGLQALIVVYVVSKNGIKDFEKVTLAIVWVTLAVFAVSIWKTNRLGAMFGALIAFAAWAARFPYDVIYGYPLMGYMLYLTLVSTKARQKIQAERASRGDFADPVEEARARKSAPNYATSDSAGRQLASKTSRYTPPKAR